MAARSIFLGLFGATALLSGVAEAADPPEEILRQGRRHQALVNYDEAARSYETFARLAPQSSEAPAALSDAIVLLLGLGQVDQAGADADLFVRNYGSTKRAQAAQIGLAVAGYWIEHEEFAGAEKRLSAWISAFDRSAPLEQRVVAHAWLGRALMRQKDAKDAKKADAEYARARDLWGDGSAAASQEGLDAAATRSLARAITAAGEALFFFAEQKRAAADAIRMPVYTGRGDKAEVLKFVNEKVATWMKKKQPAIEAAEKEYIKVLNIRPTPPPEWVIASAARVGQLWAKFVTDFRATPVPAEWKRGGPVPGFGDITYEELRALYYQTIDSAAEPLKQKAKQAFRVCLDYSVKFQYTSAFSRSCERWLTRHYRAEFPPLDELMVRPPLLASPIPLSAPLAEPRRE